MPSDETLKEFYAAEIERLTDSLDNLQDEINAIFALADGQPGESAAQAVKRRLDWYSQRSRDEDTARIRLNHARIKAEDTVRSLREMLDSQGRISEQHRARVHTLAERVTALERVARASYGIIHEGLHGGRPTDPEHQEVCQMPACQKIRAALTGNTVAAVQACSRCYPICEHWTEPTGEAE